ncbi:TraB/GumN family protein [Paracoccus sp. P2]|uniref:TraB/GumN family protein n=1 Tax=Paracoccus sp. P2 TaxID=3248840 RepID=UPI00391F4D28
MRLTPILTALFAAVTPALPAAAQDCMGQNLFERMPPERLAELHAAAEGVPYRHGLFWQAEKGEQRVTLLGTYHFADPRHDLTMEHFGPEIDEAALLMVEAGPEEEAKLAEAMASDPSLLVDPEEPTLPERFSDVEWKSLSAALEARGLPAVIASRLRPWYVAVMLGVSPCMMRVIEEKGDPGGLDHLLVERAEAAEVPVRALEPWDTVFTLFAGMTSKEEEDMIRAAMPAAEYADDYAVTLADAYFSGDSWLIWEFGRFDAYDNSGLTRAEVDEQMRLAQEKLMDRRNESWIEPIEQAAAEAAGQGKGLVIGFGALHLPGEHGVLRLLENRGWNISPITVEGMGDGG